MLPVRTYTTADGLPHNRLKRIRVDREGFLWFCTTGGLSRFDGRAFVTYGVADGLPVPSVNDFLETPEGVWVATNGGGLAFLGSGAGRPRFDATGLGEGAANRVNTLALDAHGTVWAATDGGLFRLPVESGPPPRRVEAVPLGLSGRPDHSVQVLDLLPLERGMLVATVRGLVLVEPGRAPRRVPVSPGGGDFVRALARSGDGDVLAGLDGEGLVQLDGASLAVTGRLTAADGLAGSTVSAIHASGDRWVVALESGMAVVEKGKVRSYGTANGLSARRVNAIAEDREGRIWLSTPGGGADQVALDGSALFGETDGVGSLLSGLYETAAGEITALGSNWTIHRYDGQRFRAVRPALPGRLGPSSWRAHLGILEDRDGIFWVSTGEGVYRFGPVRELGELPRRAPFERLTVADGLPANEVCRFFLDSRGDVWMGAFASLAEPLARWSRETGRIERFGAADGLPSIGAPDVFAEDGAGNVWIGYRDGVLARYRAGRFEVVSGRNGFPRAPVLGLAVDPPGRLWASTAGAGLVRVDRPHDPDPAAVVYGPESGILDYYLGAVVADDAGHVLVGSNRGPLVFDAASGTVTGTLAGRSFPGGDPRLMLRSRSGALWFTSFRGLARTPFPSRGPGERLRVLISGVKVSGSAWPVPPNGTADLDLGELPYRSNLAIAFFGLGRLGEPVAFEHRLEGLDERWSVGHAESVVHFGQLPEGRYRFRVRSAAGSPGRQDAVVSFRVLSPLWRRWWFVSAAALLFVAGGYGAAASRASRQLALDRERSRIAEDLHDDLGSSLARISILAEVASRAAGDGRDARDVVEEIGEASRSVVEKLGDGIWSVHPRWDDVRSVVERLSEVAHGLLEPLGIAWRVDDVPGAEEWRLQPVQRRQIFLVLKEAITNAAKHSGARSVRLAVSAPPGRLVFEVRDDGRGLPAPAGGAGEEAGRGQGLGNMRRRAEAIGGRLETSGTRGSGTVVRLDLPARSGRST